MIAASYCFLADQLVRLAYDQVTGRIHPRPADSSCRLSVVGLGGTGRGEMAPFSDLDLMFLVPERGSPWCERVVETLSPGDQQFDIGPKTIAHFEQKIGEFIAAHQGKPTAVFHNGVFGMFEDPRFETGTKSFVGQLKRMKDAGLSVYVGGGEGGTALEKYGQPDWVTHCFTAGGTVLNALGAEPVPYLVALRAAAKGQ